MATGIILTVAQTLFATLQCKELRDLCSVFGYQTQLEDLQRTATTIRAVLLDADSKLDVPSHEARDWIDKLKDVVYDVDDLLDEFNTIVQLNKLQEQTDGGKGFKNLTKKVRRFFSRSNKLIVAFNTSLDVKKIKKKLDAIASDHSKFGFSVNYEPIRRPRKETWSYVDKDRIFGRDDDKNEVVGLLLQNYNSSTVDHNVSFVTIVGMGGLGKTALAQLVYNDDRIKNRFDLRLWVCVSEEFGVKEIISKMLKSVSDQNWDHLGIDQQQKKVRETIQEKRYLLVLDDVWCESRSDWDDLKDILKCGRRGSSILVTTRSKLVARATGSHFVHDLNGLSEKDSWNLFVHMAFDNGGEQADTELVKIGREIVKKCTNVPLSVRVTGSMLYGQDLRKWQSFKEISLSEIRQTRHDEDDTMAVLKFSYDHLTPSLKTCFGYCALFPKDYELKRNLLINLWLAHGCLEPQFEGQIMEDIGEEYFSILLNRCFFQEVRNDHFGDVVGCKMHDLVHDLAQQVAGREVLSWSGGHVKWTLRHLSFSSTCNHDLFNQVEVFQVNMIRTFLTLPPQYLSRLLSKPSISLIISNCRNLRVLHYCTLSVKLLPSTIGELVHLRYLDLSHSIWLEMLPESISKLHNLQIMILTGCQRLMVLPKDLCKLVNLRVLDIHNCDALSHMPREMSKLTCLERLTGFVVGKTNSKKMKVSHLDDLEALVHLGGYLNIKLGKYVKEIPSEVTQGRCYPLVKSHVKSLKIEFHDCLDDDEEAQLVMEGLQPNCDLREIRISGYRGSYLWSMRQFRGLKVARLESMENLEYMEESSAAAVAELRKEDKNKDELTFFPCLEELQLINMDQLKGWWRSDKNIEGEAKSSFSVFPCLCKLEIRGCPNLTSFPSCPHLQLIQQYEDRDDFIFQYLTSSHKTLVTDKICGYKYCKDEEFANGLVELVFRESKEESMGSRIETNNFFQICGSSLRYLEISSSLTLKRVGKGVFDHLTNLHSLKIRSCYNLAFEEDDEEEVIMSWKSLKSLSSLSSYGLPKMVKLPKGIQYLTSLQSLSIKYCNSLSRLAEWLGCLSSLQDLTLADCKSLKSLPEDIRYMPSLVHLTISGCDGLTSRCRGPNGEDWPIICHIPGLLVQEKGMY